MTGGAEAQIAYLAAAMVKLGHTAVLIYGDGRGKGQCKIIAGVVCINAAPSWSHPASLAALWHALNRLSPDLLYAQLPSDFLWLLGAFARLRPGTCFLYQLASDIHGNSWTAYEYNRWFHAPLYALGLAAAHLITVQHGHQRASMNPRLQTKLAYVPNLVRSLSDAPRVFEASSFDAIWIALVRPVKRLGIFLDLADSLPDLRFAVVGGFESAVSLYERTSLEERMAALRNLMFLGPQPSEQVMALLSRSKVLVNTSDFEGFPNTMLEAWSVGVPIVSLSVDPGGVIEREQLGLVSGSQANLRRDVIALSRQRPLNARLGGNGLAYVRREHSLEAVCAALSRALPGVELAPPPF
ncbi:MAG TPA: glycosyltransferase family 4 protein [Methylocella sp.]|nr:glycosyltransferase family 4 protein [Methylocella sp.]